MIEAPRWPFHDDNGLFGFTSTEPLVRNYDGVISQEVEQALIDGDVLAVYPGWNFHGVCWHADGIAYCEVSRYHQHVMTVAATTFAEVVKVVQEKYGHE